MPFECGCCQPPKVYAHAPGRARHERGKNVVRAAGRPPKFLPVGRKEWMDSDTEFENELFGAQTQAMVPRPRRKWQEPIWKAGRDARGYNVDLALKRAWNSCLNRMERKIWGKIIHARHVSGKYAQERARVAKKVLDASLRSTMAKKAARLEADWAFLNRPR